MASQSLPHKVFLALMVLAIAVTSNRPTASAETFIVGGQKGWITGANYEAWARGKDFYVGDKLVFKYQKCFHTVVRVVSEDDFRKCNVPAGSQQLTSGYDVVELETEGRKFFMCGVGRNCADSCQKLSIVVKRR